MLLLLPVLSYSQPDTALADTLKQEVQGFPVNPFGSTIFTIKANLGPYSAKTRAAHVSDMIRNLANEPFYRPDCVIISRQENQLLILCAGVILNAVTEADAKAENRPAEIIAFERHKAIVTAIETHLEETSNAGILKSIIFLGLVILLFVVFITLVNRLHVLVDRRIAMMKEGLLSKLKIRDYQVVPLNRQVQIFLAMNSVLRYVLIILLFIVALWFASYLLPWTKVYSLIFLEFILKPIQSFLLALWYFIPNLLTILVILFITVKILQLFRFLKKEVESGAISLKNFYPEWALPVFNIIRFLVWVFALIVIYPYLPGSDSKVFQGVSVLLGLLLSITSASILGNLVAGFALTFTRAFQIGDRIKVGDNVGDVIEKTMAVTKIRTIKNEIVTIPNSKISATEVINYSTLAGEDGLILHTTVTIGYDAPWKQVHELLIEAAKNTIHILKKPEPFVFQTSLDDFYVSYQINAYTRNPWEMAKIMAELHRNIQDSFNKAGVEIMSPHYRSLRDGNHMAVPDDALPKGYTAPEFRVKT